MGDPGAYVWAKGPQSRTQKNYKTEYTHVYMCGDTNTHKSIALFGVTVSHASVVGTGDVTSKCPAVTHQRHYGHTIDTAISALSAKNCCVS